MAESSLWTRLLEASIEDMLPTAYVDAPKTKFLFLRVISLGPIFLCQETSQKIPMDGCSYAKR